MIYWRYINHTEYLILSLKEKWRIERVIISHYNLFSIYSCDIFISRFRSSKEVVIHILTKLKSGLKTMNVLVELQVAWDYFFLILSETSLRYLLDTYYYCQLYPTMSCTMYFVSQVYQVCIYLASRSIPIRSDCNSHILNILISPSRSVAFFTFCQGFLCIKHGRRRASEPAPTV